MSDIDLISKGSSAQRFWIGNEIASHLYPFDSPTLPKFNEFLACRNLSFKSCHFDKQNQTAVPMMILSNASPLPSSSRLVSLPSHPRYFSSTCKRKTHYQTLGVPETASKSQIKVRAWSRQYVSGRPDRRKSI